MAKKHYVGETETYNSREVVNLTKEDLSRSIVVGLLNASRIAQESSRRKRLYIVIQRGAFYITDVRPQPRSQPRNRQSSSGSGREQEVVVYRQQRTKPVPSHQQRQQQRPGTRDKRRNNHDDALAFGGSGDNERRKSGGERRKTEVRRYNNSRDRSPESGCMCVMM